MGLFGPTVAKIDRWRRKGQQEKIVEALNAADAVAAHALAVICTDDPERGLELIRERIGSWGERCREAAVDALLGMWAGDRRAKALLFEQLADGAPEVRSLVLDRLLADPGLERLEKKELKRVLDALEELDPGRLFSVLEELARAEARWRRVLGLRRLAAFPDEQRADERLLELLFSERGSDVARALRGHVRSGLRARVLGLLDDPDPRRRRRGVELLAELGGADQRPRLMRMVRVEEDPAVREAAEQALGELGGVDRALLLELLESEDHELAEEALQGLLSQADEGLLDRLLGGGHVPVERVASAYRERILASGTEEAAHLFAALITGLERRPEAYRRLLASCCAEQRVQRLLMTPPVLNAVAGLSPSARQELDAILLDLGLRKVAVRYYQEIDGIDDPAARVPGLAEDG
jgi:hypothetical protein